MIKPINKDHVVLADDAMNMEGNIVIASAWRNNLDFIVISGEGDGFGQGDRVILDDPMVGRRVSLDGVPVRIVNKIHIIGVVD